MLTWQKVISSWVRKTFGNLSQDSSLERSSRLFEEATELAQACGLRQEIAQEIFNEVYARPPGEVHQEFGGCIVTLLALADNQKEDLFQCLKDESDRIHKPEMIKKCRRRAAEKKAKGLGI